MKKLISVSNQNFYYSLVDSSIKECAQLNKCAIIIEEQDLSALLAEVIDLMGENIHQVIIISENLNKVVPQFENLNVLIISAIDFKQAIHFATASMEIIQEVICTTEKYKDEVSQIIKTANAN